MGAAASDGAGRAFNDGGVVSVGLDGLEGGMVLIVAEGGDGGAMIVGIGAGVKVEVFDRDIKE